MPRFVIRPEGSTMLKVIETADAEEMKQRMVQYHNENPNVTLYRVVPQGGGDVLLKKVQPKAGTEVTQTVVISVDFEDATP